LVDEDVGSALNVQRKSPLGLVGQTAERGDEMRGAPPRGRTPVIATSQVFKQPGGYDHDRRDEGRFRGIAPARFSYSAVEARSRWYAGRAIPEGPPVMAAPLQTLVAHPEHTDEARRSGLRNPRASVESLPASSSNTFALPDADMVHAAWTDPPPGDGFPSPPDKAKSGSAAMLALGVALFLFVPAGEVFFLKAGGLGLVIASEAPAGVSSTST
jgi:hypothetical protein